MTTREKGREDEVFLLCEDIHSGYLRHFTKALERVFISITAATSGFLRAGFKKLKFVGVVLNWVASSCWRQKWDGEGPGHSWHANTFAEIPKLAVLTHLAHSSAASPNLARGPRQIALQVTASHNLLVPALRRAPWRLRYSLLASKAKTARWGRNGHHLRHRDKKSFPRKVLILILLTFFWHFSSQIGGYEPK